MLGLVRPVVVLSLVFSALLGLAYPAVVTGFASLAFPWQARGSVVMADDRAVGSALIGQAFTRPEFFWGRPSATAPTAYNAALSAGSNRGPLNPALRAAVEQRVAVLRQADPSQTRPVPIDLVTASASGLDPHISPEAALFQVSRVAHARGLPQDVVRRTVEAHIEGRLLGLFGEPRVNVLLVNLALEGVEQTAQR